MYTVKRPLQSMKRFRSGAPIDAPNGGADPQAGYTPEDDAQDDASPDIGNDADSAAGVAMAVGQPEIAGAIEVLNYAGDVVGAVGDAASSLNKALGGSGPISLDELPGEVNVIWADKVAHALDAYPLAVLTYMIHTGAGGFVQSPHTVDWIFNKVGYDPAKKAAMGDFWNQMSAGVPPEQLKPVGSPMPPTPVQMMFMALAHAGGHIPTRNLIIAAQVKAAADGARPPAGLAGAGLAAFYTIHGLKGTPTETQKVVMRRIFVSPEMMDGVHSVIHNPLPWYKRFGNWVKSHVHHAR